ncbi:MAG: hypothetical protein ACYTBZ_23740 [Planctomycetota bacterium]
MVSSDPIVADGTTSHTVAMTVTDGDGFDDIRCIRILFNFTEAYPDNTGLARGYMAWGQSDGDITQYGGTWTLGDATGGGRWGYHTDGWGGITYITPISCETTTNGAASGGTGSRTVAWTLTAKPVWAANPLMNDADAWIADYSVIIGWMDNPVEFDVVADSCATWSTTPGSPIVSSPTSTTLDVAINPGDSATDTFAIRISPDINGEEYVQSDGGIGPAADWQTKAEWGTTTVSGLMWNKSYTFSVRAYDNSPGNCPSPFGPGTEGTTENEVPLIDFRQGTQFNPYVRGQCPYRQISEAGYEELWDITVGSCGRGLAGGLDADTYDWRDVNSGANWGLGGGYFTTLQFLQHARDHVVLGLLTSNMFGGGYKEPTDGTFICQTDNPEGLAADWVRYTNIILQNYRQGDEGSLTGEDLRVYNSIVDWLGRPKLLAPAEGITPTVEYWEIGNEPEVGGIGNFLSNHYLSHTAYRDRYKMMSQAMLAVDPSLKIGPCLTSPGAGGGQWLDTLAADLAAPIDFVAYHPYYSTIKFNWGYPPGMTDGHRNYKGHLNTYVNAVHSYMTANGRTGYDLMATEWNPMNWDAPGYQQRSQSMALAVVEGVFTFVEDGVFAAHFWEQPQNKQSAEDMFDALRDHMGDTLVSNVQSIGLVPGNTNWRIYVSKHSGNDNALMIWGLNFNEDEVVEIDLALSPCLIVSAILKRYGKPGDDASGGDSSLMDYSGMVWEQADVTVGFDTRNFNFRMEDAEVTLMILDITPVPPADFDRDSDVDQEDFGYFQACLTGPAVPQTNIECRYAKLDDDIDVDIDDFAIFQGCISGANVAADPECAN